MEIRAIAEMRIKPDVSPDVAEACARKVSARTEEQDPGTVAHNYYFNADRSILIAHEHYAGSQEMVAHLQNMDPEVVQELMGAVDIVSNRVFGDASDELRQMLDSFGNPEYFDFLSGFTRNGAEVGAR
jgi:hypothetical protein